MKKSIGIIGGMGPIATVDLFQKIIRLTKARSDHEHIHIYVDCNPSIPDRTAALLQSGESPVPMIRESAQKLIAMGADILLLPCNTSHAFYNEITEGLTVPLINMVEETARIVQKKAFQRSDCWQQMVRLGQGCMKKIVLPSNRCNCSDVG